MVFSIIIPVYNVEKYLRQCLDSCLDQDIPKSEYEIIIVNDGSPDNSQDIIDEYALLNDNICVINKSNGGLSTARNAGLSIAKGNLIWFVDSDDSIVSNSLKYIYDIFKENPKLDLMTFDYNYFNDNNIPLKTFKRNLVNGKLYDGITLYKNGWIYPYSAVQFYIFRKCYLEKNSLTFKKGIYGEDWLFTISSYLRVDNCYYSSRKLYNYFRHQGSITNSGHSLKKGKDCIAICDELYLLLSDSKKKNYIIYNSIAQTIKSIFIHWACISSEESRLLRKVFFARNYWLKAIYKSFNYKYLLLAMLIKLNVKIKI